MKSLSVALFSSLFLLLSFTTYSQTVRVEVEAYQARMDEVNIIDDCLIQNDGYANLCDSIGSGIGQNTNCNDCTIGGSVEVDVTAMWKIDEDTSTHFYINDETCGWKSILPGVGTTNVAIDAGVLATNIIEVRLSGAEDDAGFCVSGFSGANDRDGQCMKSPYTTDWNELNDPSSGVFNIAINSEISGSWSDYKDTHIENCSSDLSTNDYSVKWRFRYYFESPVTAGTISLSDVLDCEAYDPAEMTSSGYDEGYTERNWQESIDNAAFASISGENSATYNPPLITNGLYKYRVEYKYATDFVGGFSTVYSDVRTFNVSNHNILFEVETCIQSEDGTVIDSLQSQYNCDSIITTITTYIGATAAFDFVQNDNELFFQNNSTNAVSYFWDFGDGNSSAVEDPGHIYQAAGTYIVVLTAFNENCNSQSFIDTIEVITTGLHLATIKDQVNIFPNPSDGNFKVHINNTGFSGETFAFQVYSLGGSLIDYREQMIYGNHIEEYSLSHLPSGNYMLVINFEDETLGYQLNIMNR